MKQKLLILCIGLLVLCNIHAEAQVANHVVISEVYGGGGNGGSFYKYDFIELYNPTESAVDLSQYSVQYASAAGSSWSVKKLSGTIAARSFYLVRCAPGTTAGGGTQPLPGYDDDVAGFTLSGTAAKIALCSNTVPLTSSNPVLETPVVDFVGFGTAGWYETAAAPAPSNSTSIERKANTSSTAANLAAGGTHALLGNGLDSDNNSTDFVVQSVINPQYSGSSQEPATPSTDPALVVNKTAIAFGDQSVNENSGVETFTLSYANLTDSDVTLTVAAPFSISKTAGGTFGQSLTYSSAERSGTAFTIYVLVNPTSTGAVSSVIGFSGGGDTTPPSISVTANGFDPSVITPISTIQGSGQTATSGRFTIQGLVTAIYPTWNPAGYYIQSQTSDEDNNPATSEGIFIIQPNPAAVVTVGDLVKLSGSVIEGASTPSFGQAVLTPASTTVISSNNALPAPATLVLPFESATFPERYEGMLVQYTGSLTVTNNFELGTFGSIALSQGGLVYQPTQLVDPNDASASGTTGTGLSNKSAVDAFVLANSLRTIILDDGSSVAPTALPYVNSDFTLRVGSTIESMSGVLGYGFSAYRIQPLPVSHPNATPTNFSYAPRPATLPVVGTAANLKVASFNVLNYFNGNGSGGGFPTSRGATSLAEFNRQRAKIISALTQIDADVVGLLEIENDGIGSLSAVADLVNGLNTAIGSTVYGYINDATVPNTDAIRCAIIYKTGILSANGAVMTSSNTVFDRPPVAQQFSLISDETKKFTYVINHFKSKGCGSSTGLNTDQFDGQSCYNERRRLQAAALLDFFRNTVITTTSGSSIISMGDYNAYFEEDPLDLLRAANYQVLGSGLSYSYLFSGQVGSLDHAVVSAAMAPAVTGFAKWNINSVEPEYLFYKDGIDDGGSDEINRWSDTYTADQYRSSDHDAVLVGIDLAQVPLPVNLISFTAKEIGKQVQLDWKTASETNNQHYTVQRSADAVSFADIAVVDGAGNTSSLQTYRFLDTAPLDGISYYRLKQSDQDGTFTNSKIVTVRLNGETDRELTVYPNPVTNHITLKVAGKMTTAKSLKYEIIGQNGVKLYSGKGTLSEINKNVDRVLPSVKSGVYMISISGADETHVFRFVKQ